MHQQSTRQLQARDTSLAPTEVLDAAVRFFSARHGVYTAFPEHRGPTHVVLRGQGNEEIVIGTMAVEGGTSVTGSSYLFDQQVARFLDSLPPKPQPAAPATLLEGTDEASVAALPAPGASA